jgi:hypothetical protein
MRGVWKDVRSSGTVWGGPEPVEQGYGLVGAVNVVPYRCTTVWCNGYGVKRRWKGFETTLFCSAFLFEVIPETTWRESVQFLIVNVPPP